MYQLVNRNCNPRITIPPSKPTGPPLIEIVISVDFEGMNGLKGSGSGSGGENNSNRNSSARGDVASAGNGTEIHRDVTGVGWKNSWGFLGLTIGQRMRQCFSQPSATCAREVFMYLLYHHKLAIESIEIQLEVIQEQRPIHLRWE